MKRTISATIILLLVHLNVYAGGYEIRNRTVSGYAFSGSLTAAALNASAAAYNPAAIGFLPEKRMFSLGAAGILSRSSYFETGDDNIGSRHPAVFYPSFQAGYQITDRIGAGLAYFASFGYHTRWDDDWPGRFVSRESHLRIESLQPSVSYSFAETFGVGAAVMIHMGRIKNRKAVPTGNIEGEALSKGNGSGTGLLIGTYFQYENLFSAAFTFQWSGNAVFKNTALTYTNIPVSLQNVYAETGDIDITCRLPYILTAAGKINFTPDFFVTAELSYSGWKRMDSVYYSLPVTDAGPRYLRLYNSLSGRLGAQYSFYEEFKLKGGLSYMISPYGSDHLIPSFPDANKVQFSLGAELKIKARFSAEAAAGLENVFERKGVDAESYLYGSYNTTRYFFAAGVHYYF